MMSDVIALPAKQRRLRKEQAEALQQLIFDFDLDETAKAIIDNAIYRLIDESKERWPFVRISPAQFFFVVKATSKAKRPDLTLRVWNMALTYMRWDTGEILVSREQLAEDAATNPVEVSRAMTELTKIGAILKTRRGQRVVYSINPQIGWSGSEGTRQAAVKKIPVLKLVVNRDKESPS